LTSPPIFIVGATRSGTTFLQNLVGAHPLVATSQETDLFSVYIASWWDAWELQLPANPETWGRWRHKGLPAVLAEADFDAIIAGVISRVRSATMALKPQATVFLDKTPNNGRYARLILHYLPEARFIHLIRDGRDVVSSVLRASQGWGRDWAPRTARSAAIEWHRAVEESRAIRGLTKSYLELQFEDLVSQDGPALLRKTLEFCGIEAAEMECGEIWTSFKLDARGSTDSSMVWGGEVMRRLGAAPLEPVGFSGEGGVGAWKRDLDARARVTVEREAGDLLRALGYTSSPKWVHVPYPQLAVMRVALELGLLSERNR